MIAIWFGSKFQIIAQLFHLKWKKHYSHCTTWHIVLCCLRYMTDSVRTQKDGHVAKYSAAKVIEICAWLTISKHIGPVH